MQQRFGFTPAVCLHIADDDVDTFALALAARLQHGIGLAHAGYHPKEDLELAALLASLFLLDERQQGVGIRALSNHGC